MWGGANNLRGGGTVLIHLSRVRPGTGLLARAALTACAMALLGSCNRAPGDDGADQPPRLFTQYQPLNAPANVPKKKTGEDCSTYSGAECESALCVHTQHDPKKGYLCTVTCKFNSDCPSGWNCIQVYPGPGAQLCAPALTTGGASVDGGAP